MSNWQLFALCACVVAAPVLGQLMFIWDQARQIARMRADNERRHREQLEEQRRNAEESLQMSRQINEDMNQRQAETDRALGITPPPLKPKLGVVTSMADHPPGAA